MKMNMKELGLGFNLGDSLDCNSYYFPLNHNENWETSWGNKKITKELIQLIKSKGFKTIKVPVSWNEHLMYDTKVNEWHIEDWFINRVKEVVDLILGEDLYCVINIHHDTDWITGSMDNNYVLQRFEILWGLIAKAFKGYSSKLLFESMNEVGFADSNMGFHHQLNQSFCDIIREVEGNSDRTLLIEGVFADPSSTLLRFKPVDDDNYAIAVHFYTPIPYCTNPTPEVPYETSVLADIAKTDIENLQNIKDKYNVDVVLTEFGCARGTKEEDAVLKWYQIVLAYCAEYGIPAIMWDDGKESSEVLSRNNGMTELLPGFMSLLDQYNETLNKI